MGSINKIYEELKARALNEVSAKDLADAKFAADKMKSPKAAEHIIKRAEWQDAVKKKFPNATFEKTFGESTTALSNGKAVAIWSFKSGGKFL